MLHGNWKPFAFFSLKLDRAQRSYSTFDHELLAMYSAVKDFAYFIEGRRFHIYTDHKPLVFTFASSSEHWISSQRQHHRCVSCSWTSQLSCRCPLSCKSSTYTRCGWLQIRPPCHGTGAMLEFGQIVQLSQAWYGTATTLLCDTLTGVSSNCPPLMETGCI